MKDYSGVERTIKELAQAIVERYKDREEEDGRVDIDFQIHINRPNYGSAGITIQYLFGNYNDRVASSSILSALNERDRRKGWNEANKPMVLLESVKPAPVEK